MARRSAGRWRDRDRLLSAVSAILVNGAIGYALLIGLASGPYRAELDDSPLALFDLNPPLPEQADPEAEKASPTERENGGAPEKLVAAASPMPERPRPAPIAPPVPIVRIPAPALPGASAPADSGSGSAPSGDGAGPGTGGGSGSGQGDGRGDGDGGSFSRARQTDGRFRNSDFPSTARGAGRLKIGVRYAIGPSGRIDTCEVIETSGYPDVDAMTCRIIKERYRFRPARDPDGYAVTEVREEDYRWRVR